MNVKSTRKADIFLAAIDLSREQWHMLLLRKSILWNEMDVTKCAWQQCISVGMVNISPGIPCVITYQFTQCFPSSLSFRSISKCSKGQQLTGRLNVCATDREGFISAWMKCHQWLSTTLLNWQWRVGRPQQTEIPDRQFVSTLYSFTQTQ